MVGEEVTLAIYVGDRIALRKAHVTRIWATEFVARLEFETDTYVGRYFIDEGVRWCRGHSGPAVEALAVAQALA